MAVFNAQLQTTVSLRDYADLSGDTAAGALADTLRTAVTRALPRVDTGYWTRYAIGGAEESRGYHDFVVTILGRLRTQTKDTFWSDLRRPLQGVHDAAAALPARPAADAAPPAAAKGKASLKFSFWLSKQSSVTLAAGGQTRRLTMTNGWHHLTLDAAAREAGPLPGRRAGVADRRARARPCRCRRSSCSAALPAPLGPLGAPPHGKSGQAAGSGLIVGATENAVLSADPAATAAQLGLATAAGLRAVRVALPWTPGQAAPDSDQLAHAGPAGRARRRPRLPRGLPAAPGVVPADDSRRAEFAAFVRTLAVAVPAGARLRDRLAGQRPRVLAAVGRGARVLSRAARCLATTR